jgi:hypothetical protein
VLLPFSYACSEQLIKPFNEILFYRSIDEVVFAGKSRKFYTLYVFADVLKIMSAICSSSKR